MVEPVPLRSERGDDYIAGTPMTDDPELTPPGRFEWEFWREQLVYRLDQDTSTTPADLIVTRLNDGLQLPQTQIAETVNGLGPIEKFTFVDGTDPYLLPNGNYESILRAGGPKNAANQGMASDRVDVFFVLRGDANHDRVLNGDDYFVIDSNILQSGSIFGYANGDFDYNGEIAGDDYFYIDSEILMYGTAMPEPPIAPNTLIAYASLGRGRIDVNWTAPANMPGILGFHVFESVDGAEYTQVAEIADPTARHWFKTGLGNGVKRYYRVRAYDTNGNSLATNEAFAVTTLPGPGELIVTPAGPTTLNLNFSDNTDGETTYEIFQSTSGGPYVLVDTLTANAEQGPMVYQRTGLNPGTTYSFRVRCKNAAQTSIFTLHETATTPEVDFGITINNYSFEYTPPTADGWSFSGSGANLQVVDPADFDAPDQTYVAEVSLSGAMETAGELSQILEESPDSNTIYKLQAWVRADGASTVWDVELFSGSTLLPESSFTSVNDGAFKKVTVTYTLGDVSAFTSPLQVRLSAGANSVGKAFFDNIQLFKAPLAQMPYHGTPAAVPGVIEFEDFDAGGEGVSWHDLGAGNYGGAYRRNVDSDIDIARDDTGGYYVGWAKPTEWMEYTINVPNAGQFDLTTFVAAPGGPSADSGARFRWFLDGQAIGGSLVVPNTGGYFNYAPVTLQNVSIGDGEHVLRLVLDQAATSIWTSVGNFNYFTLTSSSAALTAPSGLHAVGAPIFKGRVDLAWSDNTDNETGFMLQYREVNTTSWASKALRANTVSYAVTGLLPNTEYEFQIAAVNGASLSSFSDVETVTTLGAFGYPIRINFQVNGTPPIEGYLPDSGEVFGARSEGLYYGWNFDHSSLDRQRGFNSNPLLDRLVHFAQGGKWSLGGLPEGKHTVKVGIGDSGWASTYTLNVNDVNYWTNKSLARDEFEQKTMDVVVTDGYITVDAGTSPALATRINYIEIAPTTENGEPAAPTALSAVAVSSAQIDLTWADNSVNEDGFRIERSTNGTSGWEVAGTTGPDVTDFSDTGRGGSTKYYYRVIAYNGSGDSVESNVASATTSVGGPAAPTELILTPVSANRINLAWQDHSDNEAGFTIERSLDGISWELVANVAPDVTVYSDGGLVGATEYRYRVSAYNDGGRSAYWTALPAGTTDGGITNLVAAAISDTAIQLDWTDNASSETGIEIRRSLNGISGWTLITTVAASTTTYTDTPVSAGLTYFYEARAVIATPPAPTQLIGLPSNIANATTTGGTAPAAPTNLTGTAQTGLGVVLKWVDNSDNEREFVVEAMVVGTVEWFQLGTTAPNVSTYVHTGLSSGGPQFKYRVRARNAAGASAYSNDALAQMGTESGPTNLNAVRNSAAHVLLTWQDNSIEEVGFVIERSVTGGVSWTKYAAVGQNVTSYEDVAASPSVTYTYRVWARKSSLVAGDQMIGTYSNWATPATTSLDVPAPPGGLAAVALSAGKIKLAWTDNSSNESRFELERSTDNVNWAQIQTVSQNQTTAVDNVYASAGTTYYYQVRASNHSGNSTYSNASIQLPDGDPGPKNLIAAEGVIIALSWEDHSAGEGSFRIERSLNGLTWTSIGTANAGATSFYDNQVTAGTIYHYRVLAIAPVAFGEVQIGAPSNVVTATTTGQIAYPGPTPILSTGTTTIEAENFDAGGQGIAYHDTTPLVNEGGDGRTNEGVDIYSNRVGGIHSGEWLEYTFNVPTAGTYAIAAQYIALDGNARLHVEIDGINVTGTIAAPTATTTATLALGDFQFTAGNHLMRVVFETAEGMIDIDSFKFTWLADSAGAFTVDLEVNMLSEALELAPGGVLPLNRDFDEQNYNYAGYPVPDNQPDKGTHRIVPTDDEVWNGVIRLGSPNGSTVPAQWKLDLPPGILVWWQQYGVNGGWQQVVNGQWTNISVGANTEIAIKVEGIEPESQAAVIASVRSSSGTAGTASDRVMLGVEMPTQNNGIGGFGVQDGASINSGHKVDIHGLPVANPSPTGESESDRATNQASIDAFSLAPSFSATDVAVPMPGGELLLEFRRTLGIDQRIIRRPLDIEVPRTNLEHEWAADVALGRGWDTNIASRVILNYDPLHEAGDPLHTATVTDDAGVTATYWSNNGSQIYPSIQSNFSNQSLRNKLELNVTFQGKQYPFVYTKTYGTKLYFDIGQRIERSLGEPNPPSEAYYRLAKIVDRNGNQLDYEYQHPTEPTLVTAIYDPTLYDSSLYNPNTKVDQNPSENRRRIRFDYMNIAGRERMTSVTDPLERVYDYKYDLGTGQLMAVQKPAVKDGDSAGLTRPTVNFTYQESEFLPHRMGNHPNDAVDWDGKTFIKWFLPKTVSDARKHVTTFDYEYRWMPMGFREVNNLPLDQAQFRPRVTSVTTADGKAEFFELNRGELQAEIAVKDTRGVITNYVFGTDNATKQVIKVGNDLGYTFVIDEVTRSVSVTDADGNPPQVKTVKYIYNTDLSGNLAQVIDMSGNVVKYEYGSKTANGQLDLSDPFNAKPFGDQVGTLYAIFGQPSKSILAAGELDIETQWRYDTTFNKLKRMIDAEGKVTEYTLDGRGNRTDAYEAYGTSAVSHTHYDYNSKGFVTRITDPDGRVTEFVANNFGQTEYTIVKGLPGEDLTPLDRSAFTDRDGNGKYLVSRQQSDIMGNKRSETDGRGYTTTYEYDNWNRVTAVTPLGAPNPSRTYYDFNSNVVKDTDLNGNVTIYEYDALNRRKLTRRRMSSPTSNDEAKDIITRTIYDKVGLPEQEIDAKQRITTHKYDQLLREISTTLPPVTVVTRPDEATNSPATETKTYKTKTYYGANSGSGAFTLGGFNPTRVINARGFATDIIYDDAYRAIRTVRRSDAGNGLAHDGAARAGEPVTETLYNDVHNPVKVIVHNTTRTGADADRVTYTFYDGQHRPTVTVLDFDGDGTAGQNPLAFVANDAAGTFDAGDFVNRTKYDDAGNVIYVIDAEGRESQTTYDGAGRVVSMRQPQVPVFIPGSSTSSATPTAITKYDAASNAAIVEDPRGNKTQTEYDSRNRPFRTILDRDGNDDFETIQGTNAPDIVTVTHYDQVGNVDYTIDPNGKQTDTIYDRANRPVEVHSPAVADAEDNNEVKRPIAITTYDKTGKVLTATDPRGVVTVTTYDEWGRARTATANATGGSTKRVKTETRYDASNNVVAVVLFSSGMRGRGRCCIRSRTTTTWRAIAATRRRRSTGSARATSPGTTMTFIG